MENISYVGLSQQMALQNEMNVTANNIANMNTPGYKKESILFLDYLNKAPGGGDTLHQVQDYGSYRDLAPGAFQQTSNPLDVAIQGDGYFGVQTPAGTRYTRDGGFSLDANRQIVTRAGYPVMSDGGAPLTVPADASNIIITQQGGVTTNKGPLGHLKIVGFANQQNLKQTGGNLYDAGAEPEGPVFSVFIGCSRDKLHQNKVLPIWVATDGSRQTKSVAGCRANCQASCPRFTIQEGRALTFPGR